ncbi:MULTISPECIES: nitrite reductase large subunit NirB [unclassified Modestobacter]|uniref:nitrite reductase large subunit NirB n=1 Tax=unclassified Modestobacter TaxID=2643866 RepID=UPI0022AA37F4|nr:MULTISPECIES: nitrite reductase large subunit NirB [unclassified Modestobacter]MCZ2825046.1 nitrite reductase large subunit NirB [Modestobacter sp. VKM Ac-2981]MCZ2854451.1 nitrite reductase large subunit NirB [Modestobacter sp. VKM Ac-2982]
MTAVLGGRPAGVSTLHFAMDDADGTDSRQRLVVVGNGMAGARVVEEVLERGGGEQFAITVFGEEPHGNYNRIMLSHVLAGEEHEDDIVLNSHDWYADQGVTLRAGVRVDRIDTHAKIVYAADGTTTAYDQLVLATGSRSFIPPMTGLYTADEQLLPGVFGFRTIDDTRAMLAAAAEHERVVVVGGGLLGLEAARALQGHGLQVEVVHAGTHLMNQQLDPDGGAILKNSVEALGIVVHLATRTTEAIGPDRVRGVVLADGRAVDADMLVIAAGIRPVTEVALLSGLEVERGIVVDDQLRTDDPDVYAVGECAQHRGELYGLVAPVWEQARVLADLLTGADPDAEYHGSRTATKLKVAGVDVATMGVNRPERDTDEFLVISEPRRGVHLSVVVRDDKLVGATLLGDTRKVAFLTQAFDRGTPLPAERIRLLVDLSDGAAEVGVAEMPGDSQVCNCNGVTKQALVDTVKAGTTSVGGCMDATRAGKGCGSCKLLVKQVVEWAADGDVQEDPAESWYVPGIPLPKPELIAAIRDQQLRSVSAVFTALAPGGEEDAKSKMGLTSLLRLVWGAEYEQENDAKFINDRVHGNIQRDGTFSVVPQMKGGVTTPAQLRKIADVAEKYEVPMVKVTGGQRIDLLGVRKEDLPAMWADLGMPSGYAYGKSFRTVKTCVGTDFCRFGLGDSTQLGIDLETRFQGIESPAKIKMAVVGCPRNCAEAYVKDVGVVAVGNGKWEVYVGGAAGATIRKGDLLATVDSPAAVMELSGRFIQYYRENANWLERTYDFVPRVGLDHIKAVLLEGSEEVLADLDAGLQRSIDAYTDPWGQDGAQPATPGQFRTALPLVDLPMVPVR